MKITTKQLKDYLKLNGGATIKIIKNDIKIISYKNGFQVAFSGGEKQVKNIKAIEQLPENKEIGLWIDNDIIYIDTKLKNIKRKNKALKIARENKQLAIFDWKIKDCIYL